MLPLEMFVPWHLIESLASYLEPFQYFYRSLLKDSCVLKLEGNPNLEFGAKYYWLKKTDTILVGLEIRER